MKAPINQQLDKAVSVVPVAVRFWRRVDATLAQGQELLRTFRQPLEIINFRKTTLIFVAAGLLGLALILLLRLEISVRGELAREASDAAIDASLPRPVVRAPAQ